MPKLSDLPAGRKGKIVELATQDRRILCKLANLGIIHGTLLRVVSRRPLLILQFGYTRVAIDPVLAAQIQVEIID